MNRAAPEVVSAPVSTKDPVEMASTERFSVNVHETLPGPRTTKDPKVVTGMKSVTSTVNHPGVERSTEQASSKVICRPSEFSTMKTITGSSKKDREFPRKPAAPDLVSKHLKEASKKTGRSEIQGVLFKPKAAAVNGDDIESSPRVDLPFETTAGPGVLNRKRPTVLSHQQLMHFVSHSSAQATPCNYIEQEVETTLCSPDNKKISRLQVKVPSHQERKRTFADAGTQGKYQQIKSAALSRSRVGPDSFPPSSKYGFKMEQYRALQRSENFTTSTTEEVASHGSPTINQMLSATDTVTLSSPRKSKSLLVFSAVNVENIHPVMKQKSETCNQVDGDVVEKPLFSATDEKQEFPRNNQLKSEQILTETKRNEIHEKLGFSKTKVSCVGRQSKLEELKKLIFEKKDTVDIKSFAKTKTKLDEKSALVDLVQSLDTQEKIKPDADKWKVFFSNESDRVEALADVGKQTSPMTSRNTLPKPSPEGKTGARKSGIPPPTAIGVRKRKNDPIFPAQQDKVPGQVDEKEFVKSSQKLTAERTSDMGRKAPKQNSQSPLSPGPKQSCCNRYEHKHSEKRTVKLRWLPLPSNVPSLRLYGPAFCRIHKRKAKRDAAEKAKYQAKMVTFPEEPEEIDPKWDEPLKLRQ